MRQEPPIPTHQNAPALRPEAQPCGSSVLGAPIQFVAEIPVGARVCQESANAKLVWQQLIIFSNERNGNPLVTILVAFYLRDVPSAQKWMFSPFHFEVFCILLCAGLVHAVFVHHKKECPFHL